MKGFVKPRRVSPGFRLFRLMGSDECGDVAGPQVQLAPAVDVAEQDIRSARLIVPVGAGPVLWVRSLRWARLGVVEPGIGRGNAEGVGEGVGDQRGNFPLRGPLRAPSG